MAHLKETSASPRIVLDEETGDAAIVFPDSWHRLPPVIRSKMLERIQEDLSLQWVKNVTRLT